jgi:hypothetical protein
MVAYLEDSPDPRPRQPNMDWVNIGDHVSYSLEPVQKLHDLVHLVEEIYLTAFVVPRPSLIRTAPLKLPRAVVYFVKRGIDADGVCM